MKNPFELLSPEYLPLEKFKEIFVKEYTEVNTLEAPKDFFVYGSRGSGKSMLLNYMEFSHQLYYANNDIRKFFQERRKSENKYIGIIVHATRENLNTEIYETLIKNSMDNQEFIRRLCLHDLIMAVMNRITRTILDIPVVLNYLNKFDFNIFNRLYKDSLIELDNRKIHIFTPFTSEDNAKNVLERLSQVFTAERRAILNYINDKLQAKPNSWYSGNYSSFDTLHKFSVGLKRILQIPDYSFYLLIDNADETNDTMQLSIDDLVKQREHMDICFKIAIKKGVDWDFGNIQEPHDFSGIIIDELYSTQHTIYYAKIEKIASKRLESIGFEKNVNDFYPKSSNEEKLLLLIKHELKAKYASEYNKRLKELKKLVLKSEYVNNRVNKYAQAELFRKLAVKNKPKSYAGFSNIVHLSSGIVRQFLDISAIMFNEEVQREIDKPITNISLTVQNNVIKNYADQFMDELQKSYKALERAGTPEKIIEAKQCKELFYLIEALGSYYKERLLNKQLKEPRVFTFTLIDQGKIKEVEDVLRLGVNMNYFQSYWYSTKAGLGKYPGYALNRRLCPRYVIDHTSFRGRVELSSEALLFAMKNGKMHKAILDESQKTLSDFER
jgi:hypothetical protein